MHKIVECVPNFSEGRDQKIIDAIVNSQALVIQAEHGAEVQPCE